MKEMLLKLCKCKFDYKQVDFANCKKEDITQGRIYSFTKYEYE